MARRASERGAPTVGGSARKGRELEPEWAHGLTPDQVASEREARRLDPATDPDTIDDPDVRERFLNRLSNDLDEHGSDGTGEHPARSATGGGSSPTSRRRSRSPIGAPTLRAPSKLSTADGSGFALGLILYALGLNAIRYGWPGVTGWLSAKFVNKPMGGGSGMQAAGPGPNAQTPTQLQQQGLTPPGSTGSKTPLPQGSIRGSDGLYYPVTKKAGDLPALGAVRRIG